MIWPFSTSSHQRCLVFRITSSSLTALYRNLLHSSQTSFPSQCQLFLFSLLVAVTAVSAVGYRRYTHYRARQVEAVMARAKRMARGEGACPALLDLGSGGELLRVMAPTDLVLSTCDPALGPPNCGDANATPGETYTNGRLLQADVNNSSR